MVSIVLPYSQILRFLLSLEIVSATTSWSQASTSPLPSASQHCLCWEGEERACLRIRLILRCSEGSGWGAIETVDEFQFLLMVYPSFPLQYMLRAVARGASSRYFQSKEVLTTHQVSVLEGSWLSSAKEWHIPPLVLKRQELRDHPVASRPMNECDSWESGAVTLQPWNFAVLSITLLFSTRNVLFPNNTWKVFNGENSKYISTISTNYLSIINGCSNISKEQFSLKKAGCVFSTGMQPFSHVRMNNFRWNNLSKLL